MARRAPVARRGGEGGGRRLARAAGNGREHVRPARHRARGGGGGDGRAGGVKAAPGLGGGGVHPARRPWALAPRPAGKPAVTGRRPRQVSRSTGEQYYWHEATVGINPIATLGKQLLNM